MVISTKYGLRNRNFVLTHFIAKKKPKKKVEAKPAIVKEAGQFPKEKKDIPKSKNKILLKERSKSKSIKEAEGKVTIQKRKQKDNSKLSAKEKVKQELQKPKIKKPVKSRTSTTLKQIITKKSPTKKLKKLRSEGKKN